jgi:hypothetical protein
MLLEPVCGWHSLVVELDQDNGILITAVGFMQRCGVSPRVQKLEVGDCTDCLMKVRKEGFEQAPPDAVQVRFGTVAVHYVESSAVKADRSTKIVRDGHKEWTNSILE